MLGLILFVPELLAPPRWLKPTCTMNIPNGSLPTTNSYFSIRESPACREYICRIVEDIVSRYDVDAIHMDDYFYPYPVNGMSFPDDNSFRTYGKATNPKNETSGRRENVNKLILGTETHYRKTKEWVRFGISPFGIYRNKKARPTVAAVIPTGYRITTTCMRT